MSCKTCIYWSELVAHYDHDSGEVLALCLCPSSPCRGTETHPKNSCLFRSGDRQGSGAVDAPGRDESGQPELEL